MKDKLMNLLLLLAVGAALGVSLLRPADTPTAALPPLTALPTAACTPSPPPAQAYRAQRLAVRARSRRAWKACCNRARFRRKAGRWRRRRRFPLPRIRKRSCAWRRPLPPWAMPTRFALPGRRA